jgi:hypothetical protein
MSNIKLKLSYYPYYPHNDQSYRVAVVFQDESTRGDGCSPHVLFSSKNNWHFQVNVCPDLEYHLLWLRGSNRQKDNVELHVKKNALEEIAVAVAEYNKRKNVVKIEEAGVIY